MLPVQFVLPLQLHLPFAKNCGLDVVQDQNDEQQHHADRRAVALTALAKAGLIQQVDDGLCRKAGAAVRHNGDLVKDLQTIDQRQRKADGEGAGNQRQRDKAEPLQSAGTVDGGGLLHILRHALQGCQIDDHVVAGTLPDHNHSHRPDGDIGVAQPVLLEGGKPQHIQHLVDGAEVVAVHNFPDKAGNNARKNDRQVKDGAEQVFALDDIIDQQRQTKGQRVLTDRDHHGEQGGVFQCVAEAGVGKNLFVVVKADKFDVGVDAVAMVISSALSVRCSTMEHALHIGNHGMLFISVLLSVAFFLNCNFWVYEVLVFCLLSMVGMAFTASNTLAMDCERRNAGVASALLGAIGFAFGGIVSPLVGMGDIRSSAGFLFFMGALCSCICARFSFHRLPSRRKGLSYASYKIMNVFLKKLL